ncbi:MAG: GGDEF domain-containing protein [Clostridia bacterium]|nr:GGDEF domain-containing protein [Clostridia bacterium]
MTKKNNGKKFFGEYSIKAFTIPVVIIVAIIHISIILLIININHSSNNLYHLMDQSGEYQIDATSMQASNTVLSETSTNYLQVPVNGDSSANIGPLMAYINELSSDRRSPKVAERFKTYNVSYEIRSCIDKASEYSEQMMNIQVHAIGVMASVYPLPTIPALSIFNNVTLTPQETAMNSEERVAHARYLVQESDYAQLRHKVLENIDLCNKLLQQDFTQAQINTQNHVITMRNILWAEVAVVTIILIATFIALHFMFIKPLRSYSKDIQANQSINNPSKITEIKQLVDAFNGLLSYRNKMENILRKEAENDALTGLPNRYCMEHDLLDENNNNKSLAVVMFDVNFLKRTNDTQGHLAGDALIRTTATCIKECFSVENANNCYRIGGDEFVALISNCTEDDIKTRIEKFKLVLVRENISVSVGYAYTDKLINNDFENLIATADKNMYKQKKRIHKLKK